MGATFKMTALGTHWIEQLLEGNSASGPDALANGSRHEGLNPSLPAGEVVEMEQLRLTGIMSAS